ncbi:hypothetical protein BESB_006940 [Besnoitia besnoiti]|uniref:Uncharacterized protein n=1 Tax=Besnoitia besnoiti TaxID=94643 RepID=A0A2A9MQ86_BESBE|nr:hypothetical protein BESB_006940 [Besnoitia besnoiti]PFH38353.1 hypothetical protein BESB_006940 [Besnoitia besnoiti]
MESPSPVSGPEAEVTSAYHAEEEDQTIRTCSRGSRSHGETPANTSPGDTRSMAPRQEAQASAFSLTKRPLARPALRPYEILVTRRLPLVVYFKRCMQLLHSGLDVSQQKHANAFISGTKDAQLQKQFAPRFPFIILRGAGGCMRTAIWLAQDVVKALGGMTTCHAGKHGAASNARSYLPCLEIDTYTVECSDTAWTLVEEEEDDPCSASGTFDCGTRHLIANSTLAAAKAAADRISAAGMVLCQYSDTCGAAVLLLADPGFYDVFIN